jgi:hypothetical protein
MMHVEDTDDVTEHYMEIKFLWRRARIELAIDWRRRCFEWNWRWV